MLMPKGQTGQTTRSIRSRTKLPRLHGADLYVARLGWKVQGSSNQSVACCMDGEEGAEEEPPPHIYTGSLHEELLNPHNHTTSTAKTPINAKEKEPSVLSSRPCYRCISYMLSAGIKRVFWTTGSGTWESAKVRDLVDALDNLGLEQPLEAAATLSNIFVTKHEVLMLRRTMGDN
jgi:deoxycytidylate deaminase